MTPTLVAPYSVNSAGSNTTALATPSFTPAVGEILVVKRITWDQPNPYAGAPTGASLTYTTQVTSAVSSRCWIQISTAVVASASSMTVNSGATTGACQHSMVVERWSSAQLAATPATATNNALSSAPSVNITTVAAGSVVSWANGDWDGVDPATKAYRSSAVEDGLYYVSGAVTTQYYAYQTAASAGSQTMGLTSPATQRWSLAGIEIQDATPPATVGQVIRRNPGRGLILRGRR